jgi:hypothetical protein
MTKAAIDADEQRRWAAEWRRDGFLVLRDVVPPEQVARLRAICDEVYAQWKEVSRPESEPGAFAYGPRAWVLLHLNHPRYHRGAGGRGDLTALLDAAASATARAALQAIYGHAPLFMQMNYYVDPAGAGWPGVWHRDCQFFAGGDEERVKAAVAAEAHPPRDVHMHIPLAPTQATEVVPGSHDRYDTPEELDVRMNDSTADRMPGRLPLQLNPGDLAFFHVNSIHRGMYLHGVLRRTIAVTYSSVDFQRPPTRDWLISARGYAASYQPWFLDAGYLDGTAPETQAFFQRYLDAYGATLRRDFLPAELGAERISYYAA